MKTLIILLLPFLGVLLPSLALRHGRTASAWAAALPALIGLGLLLSVAPAVFDGQTQYASWTWLPRLGLDFALMIDGLSFLFALLILGIGLLVILYARYYLSDDDPMGRFYGFLLLFMGAMLGVVLSNNLLLTMVFWELTSLSSFLLIGYWKHRADARQGARMALAITGSGGFAMLAGVLLIGHVVGSFEISTILQSADLIQASPWYVPILVLILLGAFTKSAQFPFHFWLPHAMAAPTPVSAYLHSATMVKAGVFLLARLFPALSGTDEWFWIVSSVGMITFVFAAFTALFKHDLKGLLAYSTISHLGLITALFGLNTPMAAVAGVFHIINHATFKASLFMAAGIIDHETGTRDIRRLGGLFRYMPHTGTLAIVAASAMAGVPLLNGFLSKEMFFAETVEAGRLSGDALLPVIATLGGIFSVAYSLRFVHDVFFGPEKDKLPKQPHEPPRYMKIPVEVLVVLSLAVGILPSIMVGGLLATAAGAVLPQGLPEYSLAIWHGFNLPLIMSLIALAVGTMVYWRRQPLFWLHEHVVPHWEGKDVFDRLQNALLRVGGALTRLLDNGSLQRYLVYIVLAAVTLGAMPFLDERLSFGTLPATPANLTVTILWGVLLVACIGVVRFHHRRAVALLLSGVIGLLTSITFAILSAPDLSLTQISVELVTTLLLLLALNLLPKETPRESSAPRKLRDATIAIVAGVGVTLLIYALLTRPLESTSLFHLALSKPEGGGTNVVNVILVDFRGFDTLGEITVLGIAALGIYAMLADMRRPLTSSGLNEAQHPLMLVLASRTLLPLAVLVAVYIFLRGHNLPGGGFIAGLLAGIALLMQYMASGTAWAQDRLWSDYRYMIGFGLLIAGLTGAGSFVFGYPFLTSAFDHLHWPVVGEFEIASAIGFDLGVFLVVVGTVVLIITNLGGLRDEPASAAQAPEEVR